MEFFRLVLPNNIKRTSKCCPLYGQKPWNSLRKFTLLFVSLMIIINWKSCVVLCYGSLPSLWGQNRLRQKWEHKSAGLTRWITHRTRRRKNPIINGKGRKQSMPPWERSRVQSSTFQQDWAGQWRAVQCSAVQRWESHETLYSPSSYISATVHRSLTAHSPYSREDNLSSVQAHRLDSEMRAFYSSSYSSLALFWGCSSGALEKVACVETIPLNINCFSLSFCKAQIATLSQTCGNRGFSSVTCCWWLSAKQYSWMLSLVCCPGTSGRKDGGWMEAFLKVKGYDKKICSVFNYVHYHLVNFKVVCFRNDAVDPDLRILTRVWWCCQ